MKKYSWEEMGSGGGGVKNAYTKDEADGLFAKKQSLNAYALKEEIPDVSGKQDTISDLGTIRSGAEAGASAVQPSTLEDYYNKEAINKLLSGISGDVGGFAELLEGKQDTISDLDAIRSGAEAGASAVQPSTLEDYALKSEIPDVSGKQDTISDLDAIRSGAEAGATAVQPSGLNDYVKKSDLSTELVAEQTNETELVAQAGKCYIYNKAVSDLSVTLPDETGTGVKLVMLYFRTSGNPNISFGPSGFKRFSVFEFESYTSYEVSCFYNGSYWVLANAKIQDVL